jgi:hypothetical protein
MIFVHLKGAEKILRSKTLNIAKLTNIELFFRVRFKRSESISWKNPRKGYHYRNIIDSLKIFIYLKNITLNIVKLIKV